MWLVILSVLSAVMTLASGGITIISYFRPRGMRVTRQSPPSPSAEAALPDAKPMPTPSAPPPQSPSPTVPVSPRSPRTTSVAQARPRRLSYPKLALVALVGQILFASYLIFFFVFTSNIPSTLDPQQESLVGRIFEGTFIPGAILVLVSVVYGLIKAARLERWGWFTGLLVSPVLAGWGAPALGILLFALRGPTDKRLPKTNWPVA